MAKGQRLTRRRAFQLGLGTFASIGALPMVSNFKDFHNQMQALESKDRSFTVVGNTALRDRAAAKKLIYGVASQRSILSSDQLFAARVAQESAMLVAESDLLWSPLRPSPDSYDFTGGDWIVEFARTHKMLVGGTHLVWHDALPKWFEDRVNSQNARQVLLEHIEKVAGHYAGKMHSWSVVNEAVLPKDGRADGLRNTPWLEFLGPDYIDIAFRAAAQADPNALLIYNDAGLEYDTLGHEAKRTAVLRLLEGLKSKGTPVHALGMQHHVWYDTRFNPDLLKTFIRDVADLGLKILITEMDVIDKDLPKDLDQRDRIVAGVYEDFLSVLLDEPAVIAVITWGLSDAYSWLSWAEPREDGAPVRPLPLDANMNRKLAWNAIARTFDRAVKLDSSPLWDAWQYFSVRD